MRTFQVLMFTLCLIGGLHLLLQAPVFYLPDSRDASVARLFDAQASRLLGGGLLAIAGLALIFLRHHYYASERRLPGRRLQSIYFGLAVLALGLITIAFNLATPGPNPESRAAQQSRP